ncbi:unnamed protein product, partial [Rhizoctonia solani]
EKDTTNLQGLCGLSDSRWAIFRGELRDIATKNGVDSRLSLTNQLTRQCITDTVNDMIKSRPEIKIISDPDWFIRQVLRTLLKTSSESYRNLANDKPPRQKKPSHVKHEDTETTVPSENESQDMLQMATNSGSSQQVRRPKVKKLSQVENEDENEGTETTKSSNIEKALPQDILFGKPKATQETWRSQQPKARMAAEMLHVVREPEWSSPSKSPFALQQDDSILDAFEAIQQDASDDEPPTPVPIKNPGGAHRGGQSIRMLTMAGVAPASKSVANDPTIKALVAYDDDDSEQEDSRISTTGNRQNPIPELATKSTRPTPNVDEPTTSRKKTSGIPNNLERTDKHDPQINKRTNRTSQPLVEPTGNVNGSALPTSSTDLTIASRKRKQDADVPPELEAPAPKKGKKGTTAALQTPVRAKLSKNFETPLAASPLLTAARITRAKAALSVGASSSSVSSPTAMAIPAAVLSKQEVRKAAAIKAAATRAANRKAKENAMAQNSSKARGGQKK